MEVVRQKFHKPGDPLPQKLQQIICNNVRFYEHAPYTYVIYQNKHIPHAGEAMYRKVDEIRKFAERNMGYLTIDGKQLSEIPIHRFAGYTRISGIYREVVVEMNCACVAAKAFDALVSDSVNMSKS